jgi:hypothetical protein
MWAEGRGLGETKVRTDRDGTPVTYTVTAAAGGGVTAGRWTNFGQYNARGNTARSTGRRDRAHGHRHHLRRGTRPRHRRPPPIPGPRRTPAHLPRPHRNPPPRPPRRHPHRRARGARTRMRTDHRHTHPESETHPNSERPSPTSDTPGHSSRDRRHVSPDRAGPGTAPRGVEGAAFSERMSEDSPQAGGAEVAGVPAGPPRRCAPRRRPPRDSLIRQDRRHVRGLRVRIGAAARRHESRVRSASPASLRQSRGPPRCG